MAHRCRERAPSTTSKPELRFQSRMSDSPGRRHWSHPLAKLAAFYLRMAERQCEAVNRIVSGENFFWVQLRRATRILEAVTQGVGRRRLAAAGNRTTRR